MRDKKPYRSRRNFIKTVTASSAVGVAGLAGCVGDPDEAGDGAENDVDFDTVPLGIIEPFTGDFAELAEERNQGEMLGIETINESPEYDFEFEFEEYDTQLDPEVGVQVANEAVTRFDAQFLTGAISSSVALAINEVASNNEVIYTPGAADISITGSNCNEYVFRFETSTAQIAEGLTQWMVEEDMTNLHYQVADYAYGQSVQEEIDRRMGQLTDDYSEVGLTAVDQGASDFDSALTQIQQNLDEMDALVVGATGGHLVRFLAQAAERNLQNDIPVVTTTGSFFSVRAGAGPAAYNVFSGTRYTPSIETGDNQEFVQAYQDEYDELPDNFSRVGFESVRMIANGIQAAGSRDPTVVKDVLPGLMHDTIFGEVQFRECDQQATNPVWVSENVPPGGEEGPADVELLLDLDGEGAAPPCNATGCDL